MSGSGYTTPTTNNGEFATVLNGGALEGASVTERETALWFPSMGTPDQIIRYAKTLTDARGRDTVRNNGYTAGAMAFQKDAIVGAQYSLNSQPNWRFLSTISKSFDNTWAQEFSEVVEARFSLLANSENAWLDAAGRNNFTAMLRLVIGIFFQTGDVPATCQWLSDPGRPVKTAVQLIGPDRLCNPYGVMDTRTLRRGIEMDKNGRHIAYNFRKGERFDYYPDDYAWTWERVLATKPWGRKQVIFIQEQMLPDQSRGVADMVSALKNMRMTKKFQEVTLQNAVVNASYAAAIESELPSEAIAMAMGQGSMNPNGDPGLAMLQVYQSYMTALGGYLGAANNIKVDGAQIPHLFPGTKLNMQPAKTVGGVGSSFEESLQRHTAAALGMSYEEFSRDFSKTNYSSGRAAMGVSAKFMASRKRHVADRFANEVFALVLEEEMANGNVPLPAGQKRDVFYQPLAKEAFTSATWIGSGAGQLDELKETQAAILRVGAGLSTWEQEISKLGGDWRTVFEQRAREEAKIAQLRLDFNLTASKPLGKDQTPKDLNEDGDEPEQDPPPALENQGN